MENVISQIEYNLVSYIGLFVPVRRFFSSIACAKGAKFTHKYVGMSQNVLRTLCLCFPLGIYRKIPENSKV